MNKLTKKDQEMFDIKTYQLPSDCSLVLRVCHEDMSSSRGFVWPSEVGASVKCFDFNPKPVCGYGLHGWLWGVGSVRSADAMWGFTEANAKWLVLEVETASIIALEGGVKHKFETVRRI